MRKFMAFLLLVLFFIAGKLTFFNPESPYYSVFHDVESTDELLLEEAGQGQPEQEQPVTVKQETVRTKNASPKAKAVKTVQPKEETAEVANSNHLKFKGVPIDGTLKQFVERMKQKGFRVEEVETDYARLGGDFAAFKECTVYVSTLENKDLVARIAVLFPMRDQWKTLYGDYKLLKELLTEKYGKPSACTEQFQGVIEYIGSISDSVKMMAVNNGDCKYNTRFTLSNGTIVLSIEHQDFDECYVQLFYLDKENSNAIRELAKDDL